MYQQAKVELHHNVQQHLRESQSLRDQLESIQLAMERERAEYDEIKQQCMEQDECHRRLLQNVQQSEDYEQYCKGVCQEAEELVQYYKAKAEGVEQAGVQKGRTIGAMILESAKNKQLVDTMSGNYSEENIITKLKYVMDENVNLQLQNTQLDHQVAALVAQVENSNKELVNLTKALELASEDKQPNKKTRRRKTKDTE
jgi:hypothetical protein